MSTWGGRCYLKAFRCLFLFLFNDATGEIVISNFSYDNCYCSCYIVEFTMFGFLSFHLQALIKSMNSKHLLNCNLFLFSLSLDIFPQLTMIAQHAGCHCATDSIDQERTRLLWQVQCLTQFVQITNLQLHRPNPMAALHSQKLQS